MTQAQAWQASCPVSDTRLGVLCKLPASLDLGAEASGTSRGRAPPASSPWGDCSEQLAL